MTRPADGRGHQGEIIMKTIPTLLSASLLTLAASAAQALPILHVTKERFTMNAEVTLEYPQGDLKTFRDSYSGSSLVPGTYQVNAYDDIHYIPYPEEFGDYGVYDVSANATLDIDRQQNSTLFYMFNEVDVYLMWDSEPEPDKVLASVVDIASVTRICWEFEVSGMGASVDYLIYNEGTYAPMSLLLYDMTTALPVVDREGAYWRGRDSLPLIDGHRYHMNYLVSDRGWDDDDIASWIRFNASVVKVAAPEPAISVLLAGGLIGMGWIRRHL